MEVHFDLSADRRSGNGVADATIVRCATRADGAALAELYSRCYRSTDGRTPADNYPYTEVLNPAWMARALAAEQLQVLIAESGGRLCGAVAAAPEVSASGGLAEFFGLVTDGESRRRGVASRLLQQLCASIGPSVQVAIGEVRTADAAAAQVVRKTVLQPVGFEMFVHFMLAGAESMVAVCAASDAALRSRSPLGSTTPRSHQLGALVLGPMGLDPPGVVARELPSDRRAGRLVVLQPGAGHILPGTIGTGPFLTIHQMEVLARSRSSFEPRAYGLVRGGGLVAQARVVRDHRDHRVRILDLTATDACWAASLLSRLVDTLEAEARGRLLVIVAEVSTENAWAQQALEVAGFHPTAYFPAVVHRKGRRFDAVQYSRISGAIADSACFGDADWPDARRIAEHVVAPFRKRGRSQYAS